MTAIFFIGFLIFYLAIWIGPYMTVPEYLKKHYGQCVVDIQIKELLTYQEGPVFAKKRKTCLGSYINQILTDDRNAGYLAQMQLQDIHPRLKNDVQFPDIFSHSWLTSLNLWMGPAGTKSKLHYDSDHNLFAQLAGIKKVRLISPKDSPYCYPINQTWYDTYSPIDIENIDSIKFLLFSHAKIYEVEVHPGQILFITKGWWHDVRSLTPSISLNLWWVTWPMFFKEILGELSYYFSRLLKLKSSPSLDRKNSYLYLIKRRFMEDFWL